MGLYWFSRFRSILVRAVRVAGPVLVSILVLSVLLTGSVNAGTNSVDWAQCANDDGLGVGKCVWQGSNVNTNQGQYSEGMAIPQRLMLENVVPAPGPSSTHTIVFAANWLDSGKHAFDWLVSWNQAVQLASLIRGQTMDLRPCGNLSDTGGTLWLTDCTAMHSINPPNLNVAIVPVPGDPFQSAMWGVNGPSTQARINSFEAWMGPRTINLIGDPACMPGCSISGASLSLMHVANPADTTPITTDNIGGGSNWIQYTLTYTSSSPKIIVELAGHIATGNDPDQPPGTFWGTGFGGAGLISGSSYHFKLLSMDGSPTGSQDNQMAVGDSPPVPTMTTLISNPAPNNLTIPIFDTLTINGTNGTLAGDVTFYVCGPTNGVAPCLGGTPVGGSQAVSGTTATIQSASFTPSAFGTYCFRTLFTSSNTTRANGHSSGNAFTTTGECSVYNAPTAVTLSSFGGNAVSANVPQGTSLARLAFWGLIGIFGVLGAGIYLSFKRV